jgi:hypothetical protein
LSINHVHTTGSLLQVEIDCEIIGTPSQGTKLAAAVEIDGVFYFLPGLSQDVQWFSGDIQTGTHELIQFPVEAVPSK